MKAGLQETKSRGENFKIYFESLERVAPDLWKKYRPRLIERGHDRVTYDIPSHPNIVVKVSLHSIEKFLRFQKTSGLTLDDLPREAIKAFHRDTRIERARFTQLAQFFPSQHLLRYKSVLAKVPVTPEILQDLPSGPMDMAVKEAWAFVTIQEYAREVHDPNHLTLVCGYPEHEDDFHLDPKKYNKLTRDALFADPKEKDLLSRVVEIQKSTVLEDLIGSMIADSHLRNSVKDFVERTIAYAKETQEIIDIFGDDNVLFYRDHIGWNYRLIDPIFPLSKILLHLRQAMFLLEIDKPLGNMTPERVALHNGLNFVRTIHGLAHHLGVTERIPFPARFKKAKVDYLKAIQTGEK
ncbi:hypothetical protein FJZ48_02695 [Candidatus Uhrbacteria bacterium]|nr:hypothetical protein [Candidatus Uhrbacteria bacterium]